MDVPTVIRRRLVDLGLEQKELAAAAEVTESYVSQLLARKKMPPASDRTDIYEKFESLLKLPSGELSRLADLQRREHLKRRVEDPPAPLFAEVRNLILRKSLPAKTSQIRAIFEKQPFGELERLVTQKLLDVVKKIAREELSSENWVHLLARMSGRSYRQMRVSILEFLDTDVFSVSIENCVSFLDPLIESWDIDLATFAMGIVLAQRLAPVYARRFEFIETERATPEEEPGFKEFLGDPSLSGDATPQEIEFLGKLRFKQKRPTSLYFYRELQNLRDPLHFSPRETVAVRARDGNSEGQPATKSKRRTVTRVSIQPARS